ncbi:oxidoreductase [Bordetella trematum]|nr:oxidoreductase [Bordetella trematum]
MRQQRNARGEPGLGSGWLTERCPLDGKVALRLRSNPGFHLPPGDFPLVLIGNGTGLAGLRAWLKARAALGHGRNWLIFGERHADHDALLCDELQDWQRQGLLPELDLVYSRQGQGYVQDRLRQRAGLLREWVGAGAVIALCGSLQGMARGWTRPSKTSWARRACKPCAPMGACAATCTDTDASRRHACASPLTAA